MSLKRRIHSKFRPEIKSRSALASLVVLNLVVFAHFSYSDYDNCRH